MHRLPACCSVQGLLPFRLYTYGAGASLRNEGSVYDVQQVLVPSCGGPVRCRPNWLLFAGAALATTEQQHFLLELTLAFKATLSVL